MDGVDTSKEALFAQIGMTSHAERAWRCLIENPDDDVIGLAERTNLSGDDLQDAIDELENMSFVRRSFHASGVVAVDPQLAVSRHASQVEREIAATRESLTLMQMVVPDLVSEFHRARVNAGELPGFQLVTDIDEVRRQISFAAESERLESRYLAVDCNKESMQAAWPTDERTLGRGIRQRTIIRADALASPDVYDAFDRLAALGESVRTLPEVSIQMLVFDDELAVVPADPKDNSQGAVFIHAKSLVALLAQYFDRLWLDADPIFNEIKDAERPTARQTRILELMANGTKDERIARILNVGARTVRREIAELKRRLGVNSRTEIVAAAIRRGWL